MAKNTRHKRKSKSDRDCERNPPTRNAVRVLIVCEGSKTEPNYFKGLRHDCRISSATVEIPVDNDPTPLKVLDYAETKYRSAMSADNPFDRVFCVFDKDRHHDYADALQKIEHMTPRDVFCAIPSVPCFEYFLLLHYEYTTSPFVNAQQAMRALKKHIVDYDKGDANIFETVKAHIETAKTNAEKSLTAAQTTGTDNPSTHAHTLVAHMQNLARP